MKTSPPPGEIVFNLWYVYDADGLIYRVLARLHLETGTEAEVLARLRQRAVADYVIARQFELPSGFHMTICDGSSERKMPVLPVIDYQLLAPLSIFEEAIKQMESELPGFCPLEVPQDPIVCITPLLMTEAGDLQPQVSESVRFDRVGGWPHGEK